MEIAKNLKETAIKNLGGSESCELYGNGYTKSEEAEIAGPPDFFSDFLL